MGVAKFAIPTVLLAKTGGQIAFFWPAGSWLTLATSKISYALAVMLSLFPADKNLDLLAGWACGTAAMISIWFIRLGKSKQVLTLPTEREQQALMRMRALLRIHWPVRLRCSDDVVEPALRGIWHPTITISKGLSDRLTPAEFEAVLLHELVHARRFDNLTSAFVHALVCLFWFHPLLWVLERRLNVERERACDETVMACGMEPEIYAAGILKVCQFQLFDAAPGVRAPGMSSMTGADLRTRLERILDAPAPASLRYVPWLLMAGLTIFMTLVPIAGGYCEQCGSNGQSSSEPATGFRCKTPTTCAQGAPRGVQ
jgi:beta-lactamase regulating signal transducer with metallopeptidase domain